MDLLVGLSSPLTKPARSQKGIWLDTFSFQAPEFYKRLGYSEFGRIDGYPENEARLFFVKRL
jgi:hypothetical protein